MTHGGALIAEALSARGVRFLFTLCGGHISPILVGAKARGIRVVDVRDEATAVFAADAVARLSGVPGVAAVTAGPGLTNAITAIKNAELAQSPVVVLGGATATALKNRGALQDIDQMALLEPHVKFAARVRRVRDLAATVALAFDAARDGVPGPVFVECPVDLLYPEELVRQWYGLGESRAARGGGGGGGMRGRLAHTYLRRHLRRLFAGPISTQPAGPAPPVREVSRTMVAKARAALHQAEQPVLLVGSQATLLPQELGVLVQALERLGVPIFVSGMARGLLGREHPLLFRHRRAAALHEADLVMLAGVPCDFRMDYGRQINPRARLIAVNRSRQDLARNRRPDIGAVGDPGGFLQQLGEGARPRAEWASWIRTLRERDDARRREIDAEASKSTDYINPLSLCRAIEAVADRDSVLVADGGDFVATASYLVSPRSPLSWLDPGPFGTLGVGAGFALGAKLCRPESEVWILYGDGSAAFSLAEFDTFARHGVPVIAVVGNDAGWTQIARGQIQMLEDDVGTVLCHTDYDRVAAGYGGEGFKVSRPEDVAGVLADAKRAALRGTPVLVNALIGRTEFRSGSIAI